MARLDFRLVPDLTPELVLTLLREHLDVRGFKDIDITELEMRLWQNRQRRRRLRKR